MSACPNCGNKQTSVVRSDIQEDGRMRRRRKCGEGCGLRYYTIELAEQQLTVFEKLASAMGSIKAALLG